MIILWLFSLLFPALIIVAVLVSLVWVVGSILGILERLRPVKRGHDDYNDLPKEFD